MFDTMQWRRKNGIYASTSSWTTRTSSDGWMVVERKKESITRVTLVCFTCINEKKFDGLVTRRLSFLGISRSGHIRASYTRIYSVQIFQSPSRLSMATHVHGFIFSGFPENSEHAKYRRWWPQLGKSEAGRVQVPLTALSSHPAEKSA